MASTRWTILMVFIATLMTIKFTELEAAKLRFPGDCSIFKFRGFIVKCGMHIATDNGELTVRIGSNLVTKIPTGLNAIKSDGLCSTIINSLNNACGTNVR